MNIGDWKKWENIHEDPEQKKRIDKSYKAECTPLLVDTEALTGSFRGSSGEYQTTLISCSCIDYSRRKKPCKHMYRLAIELGIFGDKSAAKNDPNAIKMTKRQKTESAVTLIGRIENYSDDIQKEIKDVLYLYLYAEKSSAFYPDGRFLAEPIEDGILSSAPAYSYFMGQRLKKTLKADLPALAASLGDTIPLECKTAKEMKNWLESKAETYGPVLFPHCLEVRPSAEIEEQPLTIYKYLHRKFDESAIYDTIYDGTVDEDGYLAGVKYERDLPDDFATDLLNYFGTNPIKK